MKKEILKLSITVLSILLLIGCNSDSNTDNNTSDTISSNQTDTNSSLDNNDVLPPIDDNISVISDNNTSNIDFDHSIILDNNIIAYYLLPLEFEPLVDMKVGVNHNWCNEITIPTDNVKYVSTTGNDNTADGSMTHPYKTVFKAVEDAQSGDTIVIRSGTYVETGEIRVRVPNVTITSYPNEWAIIDRSSSTYVGSEDSGIYLDVDSDGSTIQCLEVKGGLYAISTETKWDWDEEDKMGATNITINNVKAHDSYADVIRVKPNSDDFNITYSEIYNSGIGQNPDNCNAEGIDNVNSDRMNATHLYIHNICSNGIYFKGGATDGEISYSLVENTGEGGIMLGFDTSPEYFDMSTNSQMYECKNCKAHHNLIRNANGAGIGFYASRGAKAYYNTIINSSSRFHAPIYFGITFQDWDSNAKRPANVYPEVQHNIVSQTTVMDRPIVAIRYSDELGGLRGLSGILNIDNNCYYQKSASDLAVVGSARFEDGRNGGWSGNFQEWQQHISNDHNSKEVNPLLDVKGVSTTLACKFNGYKIGHTILDNLLTNQ